jgi:hypothetical protein
MKITETERNQYRLEAETDADYWFLADMSINRTARVTDLDISTVERPAPGSIAVTTKRDSTGDLLQTLLKLNALFRGQPQGQGHVGTDAADPHAQERALAIVKKLNLVLDALGAPVSDDQAAQVVAESHNPFNGQSAIVNAEVTA